MDCFYNVVTALIVLFSYIKVGQQDDNIREPVEGVVYTCITGKYDNCIPHHYINPKYDYICFTDHPPSRPEKFYPWKFRPLVYKKLDHVRNSRWHKLYPHLLFPDYQKSIWIDANIDVQNSTLFDDINKIDTGFHKMAIPIHPFRTNIYDEFEVCINSKNDSEELMMLQRDKIRETGFLGFYNYFHENNIILRIHHDPKIIAIMEEWREWISNYSRRDQLSLSYVLWKNQLFVPTLTLTPYRSNDGFRFTAHKKDYSKK